MKTYKLPQAVSLALSTDRIFFLDKQTLIDVLDGKEIDEVEEE